jgi:hypothetical protein
LLTLRLQFPIESCDVTRTILLEFTVKLDVAVVPAEAWADLREKTRLKGRCFSNPPVDWLLE